MRGVAAYQASTRRRSVREQEADVFVKINAGLRLALDSDVLVRSRAVADNERLWMTVIDVMRDPTNALPETIRAAVISVGLAIRREASRPDPDLGFMLRVNEHVAAGLCGNKLPMSSSGNVAVRR